MNDLVIVTFSELSDARAASSELERLASEARITVHARALVVRGADGRFRIPDVEQTEVLDVSYENALGELLRILVEPVGLSSRLASVALAGSLEGGPYAEGTKRVLGSVARHVPPGTTALVADMDAPTCARLTPRLRRPAVR